MTTIRARFRAPRKAAAQRPVSRAARMLALAHHVERLVEAGERTGYAEAARVIGLTRARLTQIMNLLLLAPMIQERLLVGLVDATERSLRAAVSEPNWQHQLLSGQSGVQRAKELRRGAVRSVPNTFRNSQPE